LPKVNHCVLIRNSIHSSEWDSQVSFWFLSEFQIFKKYIFQD
jgi:hypothetical protein